MKKGAKYLLSILVYSIILYTIAIIISNIINCEIKNILFITMSINGVYKPNIKSV